MESTSCQLSSQYLPKNAKMQYSLWWKIKTGESDLFLYGIYLVCQLSNQYLPKNAKMQYSLWWKIKTGESDLYPYIF